MPESKPAPTVADALIRRLHDHDVRVVFGYPGGQMTPLYDALHRHGGIRHILARDEQAAAFMADGFARATGKPGVCFAVCGPGVLNAATPLATAYTDSVPLLLISGQVPTAGRGLRTGYYHENDQLQACATLTKAAIRIEAGDQLLAETDRAFASLTEGRPGPVLLEVPVDVQRSAVPMGPIATMPPVNTLQFPRPRDVDELVRLIATWKRPLLMVGGGAVTAEASPQLVELAERLGAPVFTSLMGKSAFPGDHALAAGLPWNRATSDLTNMTPFFSPLFEQADGVLAVGCRFSQATTGSWALKLPASLAQIDIDPKEMGRHYPVRLPVSADAAVALRHLLHAMPADRRQPWAPATPPREPWLLNGLNLVTPLRRVLPRDAIVVADITRLAYIMLSEFPVLEPRTFLHPAGYVSMGYGLPAALGARAAFPDRVVVTVVGDGCFQMCGMELATAVQEKLPVVVILLNDSSLTLIKLIQERRYEGRYLGVDMKNPDFGLFAKAFGVRSWQVDSAETFERALTEAIETGETALIDVRLPKA